MAGSKVSNFAIGDLNIQSVMLTLDKTFKGQHQVSLTNYNTTAVSRVAAGSVIEIGGALYTFDSNESITGTPSDGTVYIMAVPSGDSVTCAYTNTAPTWSDSKQGWYGTGGTANNRYLEFVLTKTGTFYEKVRLGEVICSMTNSGNVTTSSSGTRFDIFDSSFYDNLKMFNTSTKGFTPFVDGFYEINFSAIMRASSSYSGSEIRITEGSVSGTLLYYTYLESQAANGNFYTASFNIIKKLEKAKTYFFSIQRSGTESTISAERANIIIKKLN